MTALVFGKDHDIIEWVFNRIPNVDMESINYHEYSAIGLEDDGEYIAGCLYSNHTGHDIHMHFASDSSKCATKRNFGNWFRYPFVQLGCKRVTAIVEKGNKKSRKFIEGAGFQLEGVARRGWDGQKHACIYGMLYEECRYIKTPKDRREENGKKRR
jgi:hypothetical protein